MSFRFTFPPTEERELANGMRTIWLSDFSRPVLTVMVQIRAGRHDDPFGLEGVAELAAGLMTKGVRSMTSEEFSGRFEYAGATLFCDVREECIVFGTRMLARAADEIVPLFCDMLFNPALDAKEFARLKREMATGIQAEQSDPGSLAQRHFFAGLFGAAHPAGRSHTIASVKGITPDHIRRFYDAYVRPEACLLTVAGAMDASRMRDRWEALFASWEAMSASRFAREMKQPVLKENRIRLIDKPEYSQTTLMLGHTAVTEFHEKRIVLAVANYIFGGGNFSSRLMKKIRTEAGRAYSIASSLCAHRDYGVFSIATATRNAQLGDVLNAVIAEYRDYTAHGATDDEIDKAKQFAVGNMAFELEGLNNIVEKLLWLRFYGRDNAYIENYETLFVQVTADSIREALVSHFASEHFVITAVGKRSEIEPLLRRYGAVRCVHYQSNPLTD